MRRLPDEHRVAVGEDEVGGALGALREGLHAGMAGWIVADAAGAHTGAAAAGAGIAAGASATDASATRKGARWDLRTSVTPEGVAARAPPYPVARVTKRFEAPGARLELATNRLTGDRSAN